MGADETPFFVSWALIKNILLETPLVAMHLSTLKGDAYLLDSLCWGHNQDGSRHKQTLWVQGNFHVELTDCLVVEDKPLLHLFTLTFLCSIFEILLLSK